jgi:hypothetical protein
LFRTISEGPAVFEQVFETMCKTANSTVQAQQDLFKKWVSVCPFVPGFPVTPPEPLKIQKKWTDFVGEMIKKQRETFEVQFRAGLRNIEEAFHLVEAKDPEELRTRTTEWWQKTFEGLRKAYENQTRDFQAAVGKWTELLAQGPA